MYGILQKLIEEEVVFESGLSIEEIDKVERIYEVSFPKALRDFIMYVIPVSDGFYNWRDFSEENVAKIRKAISDPIEIVYECAEKLCWCEKWGERPERYEEEIEVVRRKLKQAPKLIPIYRHRYMPMMGDNPPVFSAYGIDIIYYGKDLYDYFQIEFGGKRQRDIDFDGIPEVDFWSDIM